MPVLLGLVCLGAWLGYEYRSLPTATELERKNPPTTALIEHRAHEAKEAGHKARRRQQWVPLTAVAPSLVDAVLISEDSGFYQHDGVDLQETRKALAEAWEHRRLGRGASTVTQQLAKNLWLSGERSVLRKLKELILAKRLEEALTKRRILSLYLNVAEWGNGVYGIEAAAREHFSISAAALSPAQAAMLAAMLPAPRKWAPSQRSPRMRRRTLLILERLKLYKRLSAEDAELARLQVEAALSADAGAASAGTDDEGE